MVFFTIPFWTTTIPPPSVAPPQSGTLLTGNDSRFAVGDTFAQANTGHFALSGPTAGMVEKSDVSNKPNTNGLIMYASTDYATLWGYLTNLLDTKISGSNYTGKWNFYNSGFQHIVFEFGNNFTFTKVVWKERSFNASYPDPTLARIKYWDGSAYQLMTTTQTTDPPDGDNRAHTYIMTTPPSSQYIRMEFEAAGTGQFVIGEIEVYGY